MKTIEEITNGFNELVEKVIFEADESLIRKTEGRNKEELLERSNFIFEKFLEKPERRQNNLSNVMSRYESYLS